MAYCGPRGIPLSSFLSWPTDDQAAALGWLALDRTTCSGCGTADWEWEADRHAYEVQPWVCQGCMRLEQGRRDHEETAKHMPGLQMRLVRGGVADGGQE